MRNIRALYPCFEGITSLKCLWFKAKDEFTLRLSPGPHSLLKLTFYTQDDVFQRL